MSNYKYTQNVGLLLFFLASVLTVAAQDALPRRGFLGAQVAPLEAPQRENLKTRRTGGILVRAVVPKSAAEAAGLQAGDVIFEVNKVPIENTEQFVALVGKGRGGESVEIVFSREGRELIKTAELLPRPVETSPSFDILYRSVTVDGARRRVIVTRPKAAGKYAAVLFLGGVGCYSQDNLPEDHVYRKIVYALAEKGYVTMRVEKSGMGDSEGAPCSTPQVDFETEVKGYVAGLNALKGYDFVDARRVALLGHSMGGVLAPVIAAKNPVKSVIVAGTVGKSWFEYELENLRRQLLMRSVAPEEAERRVRRKEYCNYRLYRNLETPEEIAKTAPDCVALPNQPPQPYTFMRQVADLNLAAHWKTTDAPVLLIYGSADFLTSAEEHRYLSGIINGYRAGSAKFVEIPNMTHGFRFAASPLEAMRQSSGEFPEGGFKTEALTEIEKWLGETLK
ncbi:MAG TPA: alpha/beta fold hydrolase [Pyrinomonadaceae bacterium]|jgi:pimeloyl-ACP methyl ester carboxylesterase